MTNLRMGRLMPVEVRKVWAREDADFTPWLAMSENLEQLSAVLDLGTLDDVKTGVQVGDFRLDILAKDGSTGDLVAIENQFGYSDHRHLGQLITYASGVSRNSGKRKVFVWIAETFRDEHRSALDWLNETTSKEVNFFGIEMQLLSIVDPHSDSEGPLTVAPRFNIVCRPNDWQKQLQPEETGPSEAQIRYKRFWQEFVNFCSSTASPLRLGTPSGAYWIGSYTGIPNFRVNFTVSARDRYAGCELYMDGPSAKEAFDEFEAAKSEIASIIGDAVRFERLPEAKASKIIETRPFNITDQNEWAPTQAWLKERGEVFLRAFTERARTFQQRPQPEDAD